MAIKAIKPTLPYAYARVSAMKSKLIDRGKYQKLLKMDLNSITRFLQETEYKESITELSANFSGIELVDQALNDNTVKTFNKLRSISPDDVVEVINLYLCRWDYENLKIVLRGLFSNSKKEEIMDLIVDIGQFDKEHFARLFDTSSIKEALVNSELVTEEEIMESYENFKETSNLIELENTLDKINFKKAVEGASSCPKKGMVFKRFLLRDIDNINVKNLIRFKKEGMEPSEILNYMIESGFKLDKATLEKLSEKESVDLLLEELDKTFYGKFISFIDHKDDLYGIEVALQNMNLKSSILKTHQIPLTIAAVLNFMLSKMIEIRNLRSIVKSKHLGIDEDYVEKKLLVI